MVLESLVLSTCLYSTSANCGLTFNAYTQTHPAYVKIIEHEVRKYEKNYKNLQYTILIATILKNRTVQVQLTSNINILLGENTCHLNITFP